jgi:hypothetical protein
MIGWGRETREVQAREAAIALALSVATEWQQRHGAVVAVAP